MRGAVLAGGDAKRFGGRPKGLERVGGQRIIDRVIDAVQSATGEPPLIVANAADAPAWRPDLRTVTDVEPRQGALGGIYTAVQAGAGPVLVAAWDMPFLTRELLRALMDGSSAFDVYAPESGGPRGIEPLCAVYSPACGPAIRDAIARGDLSAVAFHGAVRVGVLPRSAVELHGPAERLFFNVNAPRDLERAGELALS
jgi:molybdopterin-guanine dinucleotide biosynthesis protein A